MLSTFELIEINQFLFMWHLDSIHFQAPSHNRKPKVNLVDVVPVDIKKVQMRIRETEESEENYIWGVSNRVATAQGKQGIWFSIFPDRENTGNFAVTQGKFWRHRENIF